MARLIITSPRGEETLELKPGEVITVGRDPSNRVAMPEDHQASRRHCRIGPREGDVEGWEVVDLGSTNKTRVGGAAVKRRALGHGDVVEVGHTQMRFEDPEEAKRLETAESEGVCFLEWATKDRQGERVLLSKPRVSLGRRETNTVVLDDRMASGHHAEIDRDINGYTIRDLGSTNGTLVNGQPVQELLLTHGARVRVGNSRFVFKDPSMKDIEVELSQFEEDEGWGMMGEIDLSHAPGSRAGIFAVLLLFAAAAAGGYWLSQRTEPEGESSAALGSGRVMNGRFETESLPWSADDEAVDLKLDPRAGTGRSAALSAKHRDVEGSAVEMVLYQQPFLTAGTRPFRFRASVKRTGEPAASYVVIWDSAPSSEELKANLVTPLERVVTLAPAERSWTKIDTTLVPPAWARAARVGLRLEKGARAILDDVSVETAGAPTPLPAMEVKSFKQASFPSGGALDLMQNKIVLLTGVVPVVDLGEEVLAGFVPSGPPEATEGGFTVKGAFPAKEGEVPASVVWTATDEGLRAEIRCAGAERVGLQSEFPSAYLGGAVSVLGDFAPQRLPVENGQRLEKVARTLAGEPESQGGRPPTLITFVQADDEPVATLEILSTPSPQLTALRHWMPGENGRLDLVTDFTKQERQAQKELLAARQETRRAPAVAFRELRRIAQAYPFDEAVRDEANRLAGELEDRVFADIRGLDEAHQAFLIYQSPDSLAAMQKRAETMRAQFLGPGMVQGEITRRVKELVDGADRARNEYEVMKALPNIDRLERLVSLLSGAQGYRPIAAVYAQSMLARYTPMGTLSPDLARRLESVDKRLKELEKNESVKAALPPGP